MENKANHVTDLDMEEPKGVNLYGTDVDNCILDATLDNLIESSVVGGTSGEILMEQTALTITNKEDKKMMLINH